MNYSFKIYLRTHHKNYTQIFSPSNAGLYNNSETFMYVLLGMWIECMFEVGCSIPWKIYNIHKSSFIMNSLWENQFPTVSHEIEH